MMGIDVLWENASLRMTTHTSIPAMNPLPARHNLALARPFAGDMFGQTFEAMSRRIFWVYKVEQIVAGSADLSRILYAEMHYWNVGVKEFRW